MNPRRRREIKEMRKSIEVQKREMQSAMKKPQVIVTPSPKEEELIEFVKEIQAQPDLPFEPVEEMQEYVEEVQEHEEQGSFEDVSSVTITVTNEFETTSSTLSTFVLTKNQPADSELVVAEEASPPESEEPMEEQPVQEETQEGTKTKKKGKKNKKSQD